MKAKGPDSRIRVVLGTGHADTEGAGLAIAEQFQDKGCWAAGFDLSPNILRIIQSGEIRFTIDQQPYAQGFYPVIQLTLLKRFGIRPYSIDAGSAMITASNVGEVIELNQRGYR
jgi:simple sugar transport system substrate-binding protein